MANSYKTPGVFIEEISKFPPSIAQVETAIPAFIGYTEKAKLKVDDDLILKPKRIRSLLEYETFFGFAEPETNIEVTINETIDAGGSVTDLDIVAGFNGNRSNYNMYYSMQFYFANGGGPCYIVSVGTYGAGTIDANDLQDGLTEVEKEDEVTLIVFPEGQNIAADSDYYNLQALSLAQCEKLKDRFSVMDVWLANDIAIDDIQVFRNSIGINDLKYGGAYYPNLETIFDFTYNEPDVTVVHNLTGTGTDLNGTLDALKSSNNAYYAQALSAINQIPNVLPPTPAIVGIYAKVDSTRGVWKAPANVSVTSVIQPVLKISDEDQESLNIDTTAGKSINVVRSFIGRGTLVWGARTLAGNDNEWRYVPVRRFFNMVEESTKKATASFVFEPNDANTWTKIKSMIENFLILQWSAGALFGTTPEDAFYVKVGLNETMTALDILEGRLIVEIGMAAVRPAEFIILRFAHKMPVAS